MRRSLKGKINKLENCVLGPVEPGSTKLDVTELPEAEQKLFERCFAIKDNFDRITDYVPNAAEMKIMDTAMQRIARRVFDLFTTYVKGAFCREDPSAEFMFTVRFWWFMHDITTMVTQFLEEQRIYDQKGKRWKQKEKEAEETVYKTWVSDLFTMSSWKRWFDEHTRSYAEYVKESQKQEG